jgi:hypothetical protein
MFRLICISPLFNFTTTTPGLTKYIIKSRAYLVEAPPKRPTSSYALFVKDEFAGKKNLKIGTQATELSKRWKLYP